MSKSARSDRLPPVVGGAPALNLQAGCPWASLDNFHRLSPTQLD